MTVAVRLRGATKRYGAFTALDAIDLDIECGEVFGLLGPNGAGKTTLISLVAGTALATEGTVEVLGHDVVRDYRVTRRAVGLVPQEINFDPFFTVEETLRFQAGYFGVRLSEARIDEVLGNLSLRDKRNANTRALSGGMKRRLLIAKALVHDPPVLVEEEHGRIVHQRLGDQQAPLHPAGERARIGVALVAQAEVAQDLVDARLAQADPEVAGLEAQRLLDGEERVEVDLLGDQAHGPARHPIIADHVVAEHLHRARRGQRGSRHQADEGGLARSIGAEEGEDLAALDVEIDPVERGERAVTFACAAQAHRYRHDARQDATGQVPVRVARMQGRIAGQRKERPMARLFVG